MKKIIAAIGIVTALSGGAVALGYDWPPYATRSEFMELAGMSYCDMLVRAEKRYWSLKFQMDKYAEERIKPPDELLKRFRAAKREVANLERKVQDTKQVC